MQSIGAFLSICFLILANSATAEVHFENYDEDDLSEEFQDLDATDLTEMPEIDAEQSDLRLEKRNAVGLSLGEVLPYTTLMFEYHRHINEMSSIFFAFGRGLLNSTLQEEGEDLSTSRVSTIASEIGYTRWLSDNFPIATSGLITFIRANGSLTTPDKANAYHQVSSLGVGADLRIKTLFENGFWLNWTLVSIRYLRPALESHSNYSGSKLETSRNRFSGVKVLGITNVTVGYAW